MLRYWSGTAWEDFRQPATAAPLAPRPTNGMAIASLVFSLLGVLFNLTVILAVVGFICAIIGANCGRSAVYRSTTMGRRGMARWGFWLGMVQIVVGLAIYALSL